MALFWPGAEKSAGLKGLDSIYLSGILVGGFNDFLLFTPKFGKMIQFEEHIFQVG